jgi:hypothetical protein
MSTVTFEYDPWRGGFCLRFAGFSREREVLAFGGMLSVYPDEQGRIAAIESFWDHGGLPLRRIHQAEHSPEGEFPVEGTKLRVGPLQLRQSAERLELWFSTGNDLPCAHWSSQHEAEWGITLWFSHRKAKAGWHDPGGSDADKEWPLVVGLVLELAQIVAAPPIASVRLVVSDFK